MKPIPLYKQSQYILPIIFIIIICIALFYTPGETDITLIGYATGISTFLFAIFTAYTVSDRQGRIDKIRENDSAERGALESLAQFSEIYGDNTAIRVVDQIDEYLMGTLDYTIWDFYRTEPLFQNLVEEIEAINPRNDKEITTYQVILGLLSELAENRKNTISLINDRLSQLEKIIFYLLAMFILIPTLLVNDGSFILSVMTIALTLVVLLLIIFLNQLDNLSWKEEIRIFEPYQKSFEAIGKPRYYPDILLQTKRVNIPTGISYRIASYPHEYPDISGKTISIVKVA